MFNIISWNVNSIRVRLDRVLHILKEYNPDILCLQETKCQDVDFPHEPITQLGYLVYPFGQKSYNGVAIITKKKPEKILNGFDGEPSFNPDAKEARTQWMTVDIMGTQCWLGNLYVPNGEDISSPKYEYKLDWMEKLAKYLKAQKPQSVLLLGDFNVAPTDMDVYDPKVWKDCIHVSEKERKALSNFKLHDVFRYLHPDAKEFSWWHYRNFSFQKNQGLRIDLFLASQNILPLSDASMIIRAERKSLKPSDHAPIFLALKGC